MELTPCRSILMSTYSHFVRTILSWTESNSTLGWSKEKLNAHLVTHVINSPDKADFTEKLRIAQLHGRKVDAETALSSTEIKATRTLRSYRSQTPWCSAPSARAVQQKVLPLWPYTSWCLIPVVRTCAANVREDNDRVIHNRST